MTRQPPPGMNETIAAEVEGREPAPVPLPPDVVAEFAGNKKLSNGVVIRPMNPGSTPAPVSHVRGEVGDQFVKDAIRSAYDQGFNDARIPLNLPRDNAPGYRGKDKSEEIAIDVLTRLRRLPAPEPHSEGVSTPSSTPPPVSHLRVPEALTELTFAIQHNPNCPGPWLVRLPGKSGCIDFKPYRDQLGIVPHQTGDVLGFGKTLEEAATAALKSSGNKS